MIALTTGNANIIQMIFRIPEIDHKWEDLRNYTIWNYVVRNRHRPDILEIVKDWMEAEGLGRE
jgi:hypothetical protein